MTTRSWMEGPPRKILLATDLSARCDRACDRALSLAAEWNAKLVAVHVMEEPAAHEPDTQRARAARQLAETRVRADLREISSDISIILESGDPADAILSAARTHGCDLIVTGVARQELLGRMILGSTVARLARQAEIPLLIVRKRGRQPYGHIVVATDFSDSSRHALEAAVHFFPRRRLTVFHAHDAPFSLVASDAEEHRAQFRQAAEREGEEFVRSSDVGALPEKPELLIEYGDPDMLLHDYVTAKGIGLVALGTHGRSAMFHALIGSVAQRLIETLPCDVLVVREPRAAPER